ncbi:MAG TPA: ATP-binding protein [Longimicrobiaceae bacterium]|nr:ATP-binding protein [Longimicrobiaceae bacterium]
MSETPQAAARILMVDDRIENLVALEAILQPLGHELVRANSGEEALRQVLLHDFAVILLDVQMPGMNGFETAHLIKSRERSRATPIIFLTAISKEEEYVFEGYSAGAVDYMFKPFNPTILRSKVAVFVELYLRGAQLRRQDELLREGERREMELRHRAQLVESEARYADIVDSALEAIVTFGEDRRITLFNRAAERVFGCSADDAVGSPIDRFFDPALELEAENRPRERTAPDRTASRAAGSTIREAVGVRTGGERFPAEFSASCLQVQDERVHTLILRDISERRRAEEALRAQAVSLANTTEELRVLNEELNRRTIELERAMGARSRFYANMSHELRTPINAILGYSSLLLDNIYGPLNEQQVSSIERTHKAANHLLELVNDILDLSKIEAGKMELQLESVGFPELIQDLFVTVAPFAEQHGVELSLESRSEPFSIVSDARRVRQIVLNLLSNAIKFGGGKPVRVVSGRRDDGGLLVEVIDVGEGIALDDQEKIFDEFVQLENGQNTQGTGLGLPISRRLAELLGGSLDVASTPGEGSTFTLSLPVSDPELAAMEVGEGVAAGR